jgi:hypothetical protein
MEQNNQGTSFTDLIIIWAGTVLGHFTLSETVMWVTLVFTVFRTYVLLRDEVFRKNP